MGVPDLRTCLLHRKADLDRAPPSWGAFHIYGCFDLQYGQDLSGLRVIKLYSLREKIPFEFPFGEVAVCVDLIIGLDKFIAGKRRVVGIIKHDVDQFITDLCFDVFLCPCNIPENHKFIIIQLD